jgi:hypothetical protein
LATNEEILNPRWLTLPLIPVANQLTSAEAGTIGLSGAILVFFDGSSWKKITSS